MAQPKETNGDVNDDLEDRSETRGRHQKVGTPLVGEQKNEWWRENQKYIICIQKYNIHKIYAMKKYLIMITKCYDVHDVSEPYTWSCKY